MVLELYRQKTKKKYIMNLSYIVILLMSFYTSVDLIGIESICPTFINGQNIVICKINRTAVEAAECESVQDYVSLEKTTASRRSPLVINATKSFISSDCRSRQKPVPDGSWCSEKIGDIYKYEFAFVANKTKDNGAKLECKICQSPKKSFEENVNDNCKSMHFYNGGKSIADFKLEILVFASIMAFLI